MRNNRTRNAGINRRDELKFRNSKRDKSKRNRISKKEAVLAAEASIPEGMIDLGDGRYRDPTPQEREERGEEVFFLDLDAMK